MMPGDMMQVETRFGTFDVQAEDVVTFPQGLPGFERSRRFVMLLHTTFAPLCCLHAVDGTQASFLAVDPRAVLADYQCVFPAEHRDRVGAKEDTPLVWLVLVALSEGEEAPTANLRAPIVINPTTMMGCQFVLDDERVPLQRTLAA